MVSVEIRNVERVPTLHPLTPAMLAACAIMADGWSYTEAARLAGVSYGTFTAHCAMAAARIPGDLAQQAKIVAWYRGASAEVLGDGLRLERQATLKRAYMIYGERCCKWCGNMIHDHRPDPSPERHL